MTAQTTSDENVVIETTDSNGDVVKGVTVEVIDTASDNVENTLTVDGFSLESISGGTYEFSGEKSDVGSGSTEITVEDDGRHHAVVELSQDSDLSQYTDENGVVQNSGLNAAISDYLQDDLSDADLNKIINSYLTGNPIS